MKPLPSKCNNSCPNRQGGVALVMSLIILVMLTILVTTSLRNATIDERISGNARDQSNAFQNAESVLRMASTEMIGKSIWDYNDNCNGGLCTNGNAPAPLGYDWAAGTKHVTIDKSATTAKVSSELSQNPRYFNEYAGMIKSNKCSGGWCPVYRITGHTTGNNSATVIILQQVERQQ